VVAQSEVEEVFMKDKKEIKRDILDKFRMLEAETQDALPPYWLESAYANKLTADEKKLFKKAMQELISLEIVEPVEGPGLNLRLTQKGEHLLYSGERLKSGREPAQGPSFFHFTETGA
jgi:hypothetical protein